MRVSFSLAFGLAVAIQLAVVLGFVGVREISLRTGTEVVLTTIPVDPRDLFRGDYVVLRYRESNVECYSLGPGDPIYVPLHQKEDVWVGTGHFLSFDGAQSAGSVVLKGQVVRRQENDCEAVYGIESYFVPEGTGRELQRAGCCLRVRVAVDGFGNATIKDVLPPA